MSKPDDGRVHVRGSYTLAPDGLEHAFVPGYIPDEVTLEHLRAACDRYAARRTTVPGTYAYKHYVETGHHFALGCCLGTEAA